MFERERPLAELAGRLDSAVGGNGSLVLIAGEAGAGKTTLVREFAARVGERALVLTGACDPLTTPRPLGPLLDIAADSDSGVELLHLDSDPIEYFSSFLSRLRSTIRPIVVILEDLHWADGGTLDLLRFLGRRIGESKALVLGTYRDDEVSSTHPLRAVMGDLAGRETTHRLHLDPLSLDAVRLLAAGKGFDPERLHRLTSGNPFFVTEVIAAGSELPANVEDAVLARLNRLAPSTRALVETVSIAPRAMEVEFALQLSKGASNDFDRATETGMLLLEHGRLRFRHEIARHAVEASLPPGRRLQLHRGMIELLLDQEPADLARLAHHAVRAEDGDVVVRFVPEAARQASRAGVHRESARLLESVLEYRLLLDPDLEAELRIDLGQELSLLDRPDLGLAHNEAALAHYRRTRNRLALANALVAISSRYWSNRRREEARSAVDEALDILREHGPSVELATALHRSGYLWMLHRRHEKAMADTEAALALAGDIGAEEVELGARLILGTIETVTGDPVKGAEILEAVYAECVEAGDSRNMVLASGMLGSGGGEARLYPVAIDALRRSVEVGLHHDEDYSVAYARSWQARIAFEQGRWDEAMTVSELVGEGGQGRAAISPVTALGARGRVHVRRGEPEAQARLRQALVMGEGCELQHLWPPLCGLAELAWWEGRIDEIPTILDWAYVEALQSDSPWARGEVGFWMWKAGAIEGPPDRAADPFALHMRGAFLEAATAWERLGCPYEQALALAEADRPSQLRALAIFDALGARPGAAWLRARLRQDGLGPVPRGPRPKTRASPLGLTPRQAEVLSLLMDGLSNAEIADRLFISKKTAEHHVSAILTRLGTSNRSGAIARARSLGNSQDGGDSTPI